MTQSDSTADPPLRLDQVRRVVEVCDRFGRALKEGDGPSLEESLGDTSGEEREVLRSELIALRDDYRGGGDPGATLVRSRPDDRDPALAADPPILEPLHDDDL